MAVASLAGGNSEHASITLFGAPDVSNMESAEQKSHGMRFDCSETEIKELEEVSENGSTLDLCLGETPSLNIGNFKKDMKISATSTKTEIYMQHQSSVGLEFAGLITHNIIMATSQQQLVGIDKVKNNLQANIENEHHKRGQLPGAVSTPASIKRKPTAFASVLRPNSRPDGSVNASRAKPTSPAISAFGTKSAPTLGPAYTSAPIRSKDERAVAAAKWPVMHLLAVRPITAAVVSKNVGLSVQDLVPLLSRTGKQSREPDQWELADRSYRELDIWSFKYASTEDRTAAQENARRAFDRMRIPVSDTTVWDKLNAPTDRNKGICLSKLKLGNGAKGLGISSATDRVPSDHRKLLAGAGGDPKPRPKSSQSNLNRVMNGQKPLKHSVIPKVNATITKSTGAENSDSGKGKARPIVKDASKHKSNVKQFKSDEYVIDEDEDDADLAASASTGTKSEPSSSSPEKVKQDVQGSTGKKRPAPTDASERDERRTSSTAAANGSKRLKTSVEGKQVKSSQAAAAQKVNSSHDSADSKKRTATSTMRQTSNQPKKSGDKTSISGSSKRPAVNPNATAMAKSGDPKASQKAIKTKPTSESNATKTATQNAASKPLTPKPVDQHQSIPSSSHSDASRGSTATMEEYRILQTKYLKAFRNSLHLRLMIYIIPPDILTPADQARSDNAAAKSESLSDTIKTFLIECSERELNLLGMNPRDIAKLAKQDKAFVEGEDEEPWILLPDHHAQIVDEVVGWRAYTKVKMVQLLKDYEERRSAYDGLEKGSEAEKTEKHWLHERALAIKCLKAVNSK